MITISDNHLMTANSLVKFSFRDDLQFSDDTLAKVNNKNILSKIKYFIIKT